MSLHFDELFRKKLQKVPHFVKKHEKSSIWPKFCNFSNKLPCLCISMNFSEESCKKCFISWTSTRNHLFGQRYETFPTNYHVFHFDQLFRKKLQEVLHFVKKHEKPSIWPKLATFGANYHVLAFSWTFQKEVAKSASFREKAREVIYLANTMKLFQQTTMSLHFDQLFRKKLQEVLLFVKKHEKRSIWPKLATFGANYHVLAFSWTFQKEVAKSASFREKEREIIDLANTMQLFEETTMFLHFDELLKKRLEKKVHFVKNHEKSWIWSQLATFGTKCDFFTFRWTFRQTVAKAASFREKARKLIDLAKTVQLFRTNYHVLVFRWTFQQKVEKSGSIREKARKIIDLAKTLQLFAETTMSLHFDQLFRKKL